MLKQNCSEYNLSEKIYNARFFSDLDYTPIPYALSCKIQKFYIQETRKKSKYYLGTPVLKKKFL